MRRIVDACSEEARATLRGHRARPDAPAADLLENETTLLRDSEAASMRRP